MKLSTNSYINKREREIVEMFDNFEAALKEKLVQDLTESYGHLLKEIDRRGLAINNRLEYPRLSYYLKSLFFHLFVKLHRGDTNEALKLISELKSVASMIKPSEEKNSVSNFIQDEKFYASGEINAILSKHEEDLKSEMKNLIVNIFNKATIEINSKNLVKRSGIYQPRLEKFLLSAFSYMFEKLHKGDKSKACEIINKEFEKLEISFSESGELYEWHISHQFETTRH